MWILKIQGGGISATRNLTPGTSLTIGRADESDVMLASDLVSRHHARLDVSERGVFLVDLGSRNGTRLNNRKVAAVGQWVGMGDVVGIADYRLSVASASGARDEVVDDFVTLRTSGVRSNRFTSTLAPVTLVSMPDEEAPQEDFAPRLFQLAQRLAQRVPAEDFLAHCLASCTAVTRFEGGLLRCDPRGVPECVLAPRAKSLEDFRWSRTIARAAMERAETLFVRHLPVDPRFNQTESVVISCQRHVLVAPLVAGDRVLGALYLSTYDREPPSQGAVDFVSAVAMLAASALDAEVEPSLQAVG